MEQHPSLVLPLGHRLQDLTLRDLQKQEREKAANSLEAFIFETQVGGLGHRPASGQGTGWGRRVLPQEPCPKGLLHTRALVHLPRTSCTSPSTRKCRPRSSVRTSLGSSVPRPLGWRMRALGPPQR